MYSWNDIEETTLAKLDLDQDGGLEANKIGYIKRFISYANEAMIQICNAIKPKRTSIHMKVYKSDDRERPINAKYLTFNNISINKVIEEHKTIYNNKMTSSTAIIDIRNVNGDVRVYLVDDTSYVIMHTQADVTIVDYKIVEIPGFIDVVKYQVTLSNGQSCTFSVEMQYYDTKEPGHSDFISFSDSPSYQYINHCGKKMVKEVHDDVLLYNGYNNMMFLEPGDFDISYKAIWAFFTVKITDAATRIEPIDAPDDVLAAIPSYIASQCYKVDDEYKAQVYRNEYEMFLARIDDTDFDNTTTIEIGGDW